MATWNVQALFVVRSSVQNTKEYIISSEASRPDFNLNKKY